ncbi:MAG: response regulator [Rhodocyclaceae bacterium]
MPTSSTSARSIRHRLLISGFAAVVVLATMCATIYFNSVRYQTSDQWTDHTQQVLTNLRNVSLAFEEAIAEHRGYLISADDTFRLRRDAALGRGREVLTVLRALTSDNPEQGARVQRLGEYLHRYQTRMQAVEVPAQPALGPDRFQAERAVVFNEQVASLLRDMRSNEEELLQSRREEAQRRYRLTNGLTMALVAGLMLMVAVISGRIVSDLRRRQQIEEALSRQQGFDRTQSESLGLFNSTTDRKETLDGLLRLLAENHGYPTIAFYRYEEWEGSLICESSRGAAPTLAMQCGLSDSLPGQALRDRKPLLLQAAPGFTFSSGLGEFAPAAVLMVPVTHGDRAHGVIALASTAPRDQADVDFLVRAAGQLAVALHNTGQYEAMRILSAQLQLRNEEVAHKNEELEHASRMKSEFLANMSHELRTPLNAILGFSEIMRDGVVGDLSEEQQGLIGDIHDSGWHLLSLIDDILDLSKIEAGHMSIEPAVVDLRALLSNSLTIVRERAANNRVMLRADVDAQVGNAVLDERRVKQVVYNLLSNAVKFTREGGSVSLQARLCNASEIDTRAAPGYRALPLPEPVRERYIEIAVEDTGIGIAQDALNELFEPFVQLDSDLSRRYAGTGLGLSLVLRLARLHGGTVAVRSEPGRGSRFIVWLPVMDADEASRVIAPPAMRKAQGGKNVLVIEDNARAADLIRHQLEGAGFEVTVAVTAEDALALARATPPALITLDILLPGIDGWELLSQLKADPVLGGVPVVIVSVAADQQRGVSLGAAGILQKPIGRTELLDTLESLGLGLTDDAEGGRRVLVVDDDPKAVEVLALQLEEEGRYEVLRAYGGQEGLAAARQEEPDLIILDLMMPGTNGFEVVEGLKAEQRTRHIPVLIMTAKQLTAEDKRRLNGDVEAILYKADFNHGRFLNEVHRALRVGQKGE